MKKMKYLPLLSLGVLLLASCDCDHDEALSSSAAFDVGDVLCSDGSILTESRFEQSDKEAMGIVFYVNKDPEVENLGYAVYIHDLDPQAFADSLGVEQGTSASLTNEDGNENTYSLFYNDEVSSSMAVKVFDLWRYGQSAYVPSVRQLSRLYSVCHFINERIADVGGDTIAIEPGGCWLWTSTEVEGQQENKAWLFSMQSGTIQETPKNQSHKFRPIISIMNMK